MLSGKISHCLSSLEYVAQSMECLQAGEIGEARALQEGFL